MSDNLIRLCSEYPQLLKVVCDCHNEGVLKNPVIHGSKPLLKPIITSTGKGYPMKNLTPII